MPLKPVVYINARFLTQQITGVQQFAHEICRYLRNNSVEFVLLAPHGTVCPTYLQHLQFITIGKGSGYFWEQIQLPFYLKKRGSPLLLNFCNTAPLLYANQWVTIHDLAFMHHPEWFSKSFASVYQFLIPRIAKRSQKVITVSKTIATQIKQQFGVEAAILYNGISNDLLEHTTNRSLAGKKFILTVSTLNPRKNLNRLVQAFSQTNLPDYELIIVGAKQAVFNQETQLQHPGVRYVGYASNEQLALLYYQASLFVSLSLDEGFGIPVWEAIYSGCPVLLSDIAVYRECFEELALFCSPTSELEIAKALENALQLAPQINIPQWMHETYNYAQSAKKLMQWVDDAVKNQ